MEAVLTNVRLHLPRPREIVLLVVAGLAADFVWEFWARTITAAIIGGPLQPASLILGLFHLPESYRGFAEALHLTTGFLFYPLLYLAIRRVIYSGGAFKDGLVIGIVTWILALGVFAPLAGQPFMLGFIPLTWMSGIGHVLYGLTLSFLYYRLTRDA